MKREIKFRALVEYEGIGRVWEYYKTFSMPVWVDRNVAKIIVQDLQYTGLKDKNGKEIYEGDILRSWYSRDTTGKDIVYMIFPVEYETLDYKGFSGFQIEFLKNASAIGNIYENPDLLNSDMNDKRSVATKSN